MSAVTAVRCRAKDPATCRNHGSPVSTVPLSELTVADLAVSYREKIDVAKAEVKKNSAVEASLLSDLAWEGDQPAWWAQFSEDARNHDLYPTEPELLDVIDSPAGQLAVVWSEHCHDIRARWIPISKGIKVSSLQLHSVDSGEEVGHVHVAYVTQEAVDRSFGNDDFRAFRYLSAHSPASFYFLEDYEDIANLSSEERESLDRRVWRSFASSDYYDGPSKKVGLMDPVEPESIEQVREDLEQGRRKVLPMIDRMVQERAIPWVDYSDLFDEELKGKGLGTAMYVYTSRRLAKNDLALRASGVQSEDADRLWSKFRKYLPARVKTSTESFNGEPYAAVLLDFRD